MPSIVTELVYISNSNKNFCLSTSLLAFCVLCFLYDCHSGWCRQTFSVVLICIPVMASGIELFVHFISQVVVFLA